MKKCKDHKGHEFTSVAAMCDYWNISPFVFYKRKNKLKWSMEKTLTTPQNEQPNREIKQQIADEIKERARML